MGYLVESHFSPPVTQLLPVCEETFNQCNSQLTPTVRIHAFRRRAPNTIKRRDHMLDDWVL